MRDKIELKVFVNGEVVFSGDSTETFIYGIFRDYHFDNHEKTLQATSLALMMYLKDMNDTNLGKLIDWVALQDLDALEKLTRWEMLDKYYNEIEGWN